MLIVGYGEMMEIPRFPRFRRAFDLLFPKEKKNWSALLTKQLYYVTLY